MKPYGLSRGDCTQRPQCPCCSFKAHGVAYDKARGNSRARRKAYGRGKARAMAKKETEAQ